MTFTFLIVSALVIEYTLSDWVRLKSSNYPDGYVRHYYYALFVNAEDGSSIFEQDSTFNRIPALNGNTNQYSFVSYNYPDRYIRHSGNRLYIHPNDGSQLFKDDASWTQVPALNGASGYFSYKNQFGWVMRHRNSEVWTDADDGSQLFKDDASFMPLRATPPITINGITHTGEWYPVVDDGQSLNYIQGTETSDNLRMDGWPKWVKWTDRWNEVHQINLNDNWSSMTMWFPAGSEIMWYHGGGSDRTGLDAETKWAQVTFRYETGNDYFFTSDPDGIKVIVKGYKYIADSIYANDWARAEQAVALAQGTADTVSTLVESGVMVYTAGAASKTAKENEDMIISSLVRETRHDNKNKVFELDEILITFIYFVVGIIFLGLGVFIGFKSKRVSTKEEQV